MDILLIFALSFIPMLLYAAVLWWFDRYEKEPLWLMAAAFIWGAIPSIILALILEILFDAPLISLAANEFTYQLLSAAVVAPVVEEVFKALAVLALFLLWRRELESPIDGLIYGSLAGFGFAAVENVFYLGGAYAEYGVQGVLGLAFFRAVLFGLNHAMFTGFTGLGAGLALEVRKPGLKALLILGGLAISILAHAMHNAFSTFSGALENFGALFTITIVDWSGVLILLVVIVWAILLERERIDRYAVTLVNSGTIPLNEAYVLRSPLKRSTARLKALFGGSVKRWWKIGRYYHKVTEAAFTWHRANSGDPRAQDRLPKLEAHYARLRDELTPDGRGSVR